MTRSRFLTEAFGPPPEPLTASGRDIMAGRKDYTCDFCGATECVAFTEYSDPKNWQTGLFLCVPCMFRESPPEGWKPE